MVPTNQKGFNLKVSPISFLSFAGSVFNSSSLFRTCWRRRDCSRFVRLAAEG
jgi:hypothetical protein